jgi:hypothetical protein
MLGRLTGRPLLVAQSQMRRSPRHQSAVVGETHRSMPPCPGQRGVGPVSGLPRHRD